MLHLLKYIIDPILLDYQIILVVLSPKRSLAVKMILVSRLQIRYLRFAQESTDDHAFRNLWSPPSTAFWVSEQNSFTVFSSFKRKIVAQRKYLREIVLYYDKKLVDFVRTHAGLAESLAYCDQHLHITVLSPQTVVSSNPHK